MGVGGIAGIVVGILAVALLVGLFVARKKRSRRVNDVEGGFFKDLFPGKKVSREKNVRSAAFLLTNPAQY